jgi:hypothetical protein
MAIAGAIDTAARTQMAARKSGVSKLCERRFSIERIVSYLFRRPAGQF